MIWSAGTFYVVKNDATHLLGASSAISASSADSADLRGVGL